MMRVKQFLQVPPIAKLSVLVVSFTGTLTTFSRIRYVNTVCLAFLSCFLIFKFKLISSLHTPINLYDNNIYIFV